jgi:hypothetical protein
MSALILVESLFCSFNPTYDSFVRQYSVLKPSVKIHIIWLKHWTEFWSNHSEFIFVCINKTEHTKKIVLLYIVLYDAIRTTLHKRWPNKEKIYSIDITLLWWIKRSHCHRCKRLEMKINMWNTVNTTNCFNIYSLDCFITFQYNWLVYKPTYIWFSLTFSFDAICWPIQHIFHSVLTVSVNIQHKILFNSCRCRKRHRRFCFLICMKQLKSQKRHYFAGWKSLIEAVEN